MANSLANCSGAWKERDLKKKKRLREILEKRHINGPMDCAQRGRIFVSCYQEYKGTRCLVGTR